MLPKKAPDDLLKFGAAVFATKLRDDARYADRWQSSNTSSWFNPQRVTQARLRRCPANGEVQEPPT